MGAVYSALDPFSTPSVALKVAHSHQISEMGAGRFRKLFFNEAHAAGVLDHPNLLTVYDADMDGDLCYLVMELVEGGETLEAYCKPQSLLSTREVVGIIYKLAKALDYAHSQDVIHRDIKPSNILRAPERDVELADFRIALVTRDDLAETQFDGFKGSPLYMSPGADQRTARQCPKRFIFIGCGYVSHADRSPSIQGKFAGCCVQQDHPTRPTGRIRV